MANMSNKHEELHVHVHVALKSKDIGSELHKIYLTSGLSPTLRVFFHACSRALLIWSR